MKKYLCYLFSFFLSIIVIPVHAQQLKDKLDAVYGMNPILYNGRIYADYYTTEVKGHQFLEGKELKEGSLKLNKQLFEQQFLNYDVFKQKLLLSFQDYTSARKLIEVPLIHTQTFTLEKKYFEIIKWPDSSLKILQSIGENDFRILIHWSKEMETTTSTSIFTFQFTDARKQFWLLKDGDYHTFSSNKSFRQIFTKEQQGEIKKWMKSHQIRIKKAGDANLLKLVEYCKAL